jgi:hypothetical protein
MGAAGDKKNEPKPIFRFQGAQRHQFPPVLDRTWSA